VEYPTCSEASCHPVVEAAAGVSEPNSPTGLSFLFLLRLFSLGSVSARDQPLYLCHPYLTHQCRRRNSLLAMTDSGHYHAASPLRRRCVSTTAVCRSTTVMRMPQSRINAVELCMRFLYVTAGRQFHVALRFPAKDKVLLSPSSHRCTVYVAAVLRYDLRVRKSATKAVFTRKCVGGRPRWGAYSAPQTPNSWTIFVTGRELRRGSGMEG